MALAPLITSRPAPLVNCEGYSDKLTPYQVLLLAKPAGKPSESTLVPPASVRRPPAELMMPPDLTEILPPPTPSLSLHSVKLPPAVVITGSPLPGVMLGVDMLLDAFNKMGAGFNADVDVVLKRPALVNEISPP